VIGAGSRRPHRQRRQASPEIERVRQLFEPHLLRKKNLTRQRSLATEPSISPADQSVILNEMLETSRIENQDRPQRGAAASRRRVKDRNSETLTAQHQPDDSQLPV